MKALVDIGNPDAPQGSEPWCRSFHQTICRLKREGQFAVSNLKYSLRDFRDGKHYTRLTNAQGKPFKAWDSFVKCAEPYGLGMRIDVADAIINEKDDSKLLRDVLGKHGGDRKSEAVKEQGGIATLKPNQKNTKAHILARLDRDGHAELAAKVRSGEMSANAAAIEADYRKPRLAPIERVLKDLDRLTPAQLRHVRARLDEMLKPRGRAA